MTFAVIAAGLLAAAAAGAGGSDDLVRPLRGAEVDWGAGTVVAQAGAAADFRMPNPDAARPGAERRARAAAIEKLRAALKDLPLRGTRKVAPKAIDEALEKAYVVRADYQSNGGVVLAMGVKFKALAGGPPHRQAHGKRDAKTDARPDAGEHRDDDDDDVKPTVLSVAAMPLELAPEIAVGEREVAAGWAVYKLGEPPAAAKAVEVKRDRAGRLVLPAAEAEGLRKLAGAPVLIYVQKLRP